MVGVTGFEPVYSRSQAERVRPDFPTRRDSRAWFGRVQIGRGVDGTIPAHVFFFWGRRQAFRVIHSDADKKQHAQHFQRSHETSLTHYILAVSPACHATPELGWRSPATRITEARVPLVVRGIRGTSNPDSSKPQHLGVGQPGRLPHKRVNAVSTVYVCSVLQYGFCQPQSIGVDCPRSTKRLSLLGLHEFSTGCGFVNFALGTLCQLWAFSTWMQNWQMGAGSGSVYRAKSPDPLRRSTAPSLQGYGKILREPDSNRHSEAYETSAGTVPVHPAKVVYHTSRFPQLGIARSACTAVFPTRFTILAGVLIQGT
jgi:hypothetical protein